MSETTLGVLAATWGILMAISPVLQIRKMLGRRSSLDVSIGYLLVLVVGLSLWLAYGFALRNAALIVPNAVALVIGVWTIGVALWFRSPDRRGHPSEDRPRGPARS